ncbi:MAG: hypothetical protein AAFU53_12645 [Cyanobacteria bacterium J06632_3]
MESPTATLAPVFDGPVGTEPQNYAFLKQRRFPDLPPSNEFGFVAVELRALDSNGTPVPQALVAAEWSSNWTWEVRTTDNEIRRAVTLRWLGQASCQDRLTLFRVTGPDGEVRTQTLGADQTTVSGNFTMQSFRVETIKKIAINWASQPIPQGAPVPLFTEFNLAGNELPATRFDRLVLNASCASGEQLGGIFYPRVTLQVNRIESPF